MNKITAPLEGHMLPCLLDVKVAHAQLHPACSAQPSAPSCPACNASCMRKQHACLDEGEPAAETLASSMVAARGLHQLPGCLQRLLCTRRQRCMSMSKDLLLGPRLSSSVLAPTSLLPGSAGPAARGSQWACRSEWARGWVSAGQQHPWLQSAGHTHSEGLPG